jgi:hypothetical protein
MTLYTRKEIARLRAENKMCRDEVMNRQLKQTACSRGYGA